MKQSVLVLREPDRQAEAQAQRHGLQVVMLAQGYALADVCSFDRALFVEPGIAVPWHLVDYGLHFIERWDAAAPLWCYGVLASQVGTPGDRERTEAVIGDLRVLLYAHELLFVRGSAVGLALLSELDEETGRGGEPRLAFLRALHRVKPMICTLPASWLGGSGTQRPMTAVAQLQTARTLRKSARWPVQGGQGHGALVRIEIGKGVYVRCRESDEAQVRERYRLQALRHSDRRAEEAEHGNHR